MITNACLVGAFDLLNVRDLDVLEQVHKDHSSVQISLLDDQTVTELYGRPPVMKLDDRMLLVSHLRKAAEVKVFDGSQPEQCYVIADEPQPPGLKATPIVPTRESRANRVRAALTQQAVA